MAVAHREAFRCRRLRGLEQTLDRRNGRLRGSAVLSAPSRDLHFSHGRHSGM
jgi:hypothetical protein